MAAFVIFAAFVLAGSLWAWWMERAAAREDEETEDVDGWRDDESAGGEFIGDHCD